MLCRRVSVQCFPVQCVPPSLPLFSVCPPPCLFVSNYFQSCQPLICPPSLPSPGEQVRPETHHLSWYCSHSTHTRYDCGCTYGPSFMPCVSCCARRQQATLLLLLGCCASLLSSLWVSQCVSVACVSIECVSVECVPSLPQCWQGVCV